MKISCIIPLQARRTVAPVLTTLGLSLALALAGCAAVGPDFKPPDLPAAAQGADYTATPLPARTAQAPVEGGAAQQWVAGADIPAQWWSVFQSTALDALIREALARSPTLAAAQATLRQAQEGLAAQQGKLALPSVDAQLGAQRERASAVQTQKAGGQLLTLFNAQVNVSYNVDLFGGVRRQLEGAQAQVDAQRLQLEATQLMLTGNLVTKSVQSIRGNVFYTPMPKVDIGAELMYGVREIENGRKGDISRLQFTTKYSF